MIERPVVASSADVEGARPALRLDCRIGPFEVVDLERPTDAIAGEVLEKCQRDEIVLAAEPRACEA